MLKEYYDSDTKILSIPYDFNKKLKNIPLDTEIILFKGNSKEYYSRFDQKIEVGDLPPNVRQITFGSKFNQPVDNLPPNLTHLTFGKSFNKLVKN